MKVQKMSFVAHRSVKLLSADNKCVVNIISTVFAREVSSLAIDDVWLCLKLKTQYFSKFSIQNWVHAKSLFVMIFKERLRHAIGECLQDLNVFADLSTNIYHRCK